MPRYSKILTLSAVFVTGASADAATTIEVRFEAIGPVALAPVAGVFHNGAYDVFNAGTAASAALETLAEVGNPAPLLSTAPGGANGGTNGGLTTPGSASSFTLSVADGNSMFSYAAMLLPTNDYFIGNDNARDVSTLLGAGAGTSLTFDVVNVWNAGTELEDFAFSAGNPLFGIPAGDAPNGTAENGTIGLVTSTNPFAAFANQPGGFDPAALNFSGGPVGRFTLTVVPEPSGAVLGLTGLALLTRRRRS